VKIAFVSPFFGADAMGGAESECRNTAIRLAASGIDVEILTTCALDLEHNWNMNYHAQGTYHEDGLIVRRFRTEHVHIDSMAELDNRIRSGSALSPEQEELFMSLHVSSCDLYHYLASHSVLYDWLCFIPYLFGTTVYGSRLCPPEKNILIPCLHDEAYTRLQSIKELFRRFARIVFHSHEEKNLAHQLYGNLPGKMLLIGEGIDTDLTCDADRFRKKYHITRPFVFYAGRKDKEKNVHTLIRYFTAYKKSHQNDLLLILAGPAELPIPLPMKNDILDLGFLPKQDKNDAYSAAAVFCQPSLNESFSIVMMESWLCKTPCLVNEKCAVTREHIMRSGGGLYFASYADFEGALNYLLNNDGMSRRMGEDGRKYVLNNFAWETIIKKYLNEVFAR
jgi:glycosyltransferase involved in cell wall biosynthesis